MATQLKTAAKRRQRRQRGFVLISALFSIIIISTTVFTGLVGVSTASRLTAEVSDQTTATTVALSQIDEIRTANYVATGGSYNSVTTPAEITVTNTTSAIAGGNSNIQQVTIQVSKAGEVILETTIIKANR